MSFEVEIKYRTNGHGDLAERLVSLGSEESHAFEQEDTYLNHPSRDFEATGEAFRLRREGLSNRLTYKGPRRGGPTKTREEIEIAFEEGDAAHGQMRRLYEFLGFRLVAILHKRRHSFSVEQQGRQLEVVLDVAEDLGTFVEVETIASHEADLPAAQAAVLELASVLGLTEVEPRSYLRMALERRRQTKPPVPEGDAGRRNPAGQT